MHSTLNSTAERTALSKMQVYTLFSIACLIRIANCYSSGEVSASCSDMTPGHVGGTAQSTPSPYEIILDRSNYATGDEITVTLQASSSPFLGFMLQAHEVGGNAPIGSFSVTSEQTRLLSCGGITNSAITHRSSAQKTTIQGLWRAPTSGLLKDIEFRATFVQNFTTYWLQVKSSRVAYSGQSSRVTNARTTTIRPLNSVRITRDGCGSTKVCLSRPSDCDPVTDAGCYFVAVSMSPTDSPIQFELYGPSDGYIATGFSDDRQMGNDDIYICGLDSNSAIQVQHAHSTGRRRPDILSLGNVSEIQASFVNGFISCSFTSRNPIITERSLPSSLYYLMFAYGSSNNGAIQIHRSTFISNMKVDLQNPQQVSSNLPHIVKAHGALMLIAWMTTGSLGMLIARYLKATTRGNTCCNKDLWFVAHVFLMLLTVAATIIAFILIFSHVRVWIGGAHPVLGCLVMILAFIQPLGAVFRCGPDDERRYIFNWAHALNAMAIKGLAVAAIFTGLSLIDSSQGQWSLKVMGGFVGWEALLYAIQELNFRCSQNGAERVSQLMKMDVMLLVVFLLGNLSFLVALLIGIGLS
ncbi:hypothetical protein GJAV_G00082530 [Gymnothorax javanicus]|nr:hypothetical protein GJAV_G00082530 [Gymnothorax javanicus]